MENFRLFIGIALPREVAGPLAVRAERLKRKLPFRSWTEPADYHVTLHFLGETPASRAADAAAAVRDAAARCAPPALSLAGPGTFGPADAPRVLWCGVAEPPAQAGRLAALHAALAERLAAAGFALEARPLRPHVTLARGGGPGCGAAALAAAWQAAAVPGAAGEWAAQRCTLFRSHLGRRPSYERLAEFPLGGATPVP